VRASERAHTHLHAACLTVLALSRAARLQRRGCLLYFAGAVHARFTPTHDPSLRVRLLQRYATRNTSARVRVFNAAQTRYPLLVRRVGVRRRAWLRPDAGARRTV